MLWGRKTTRQENSHCVIFSGKSSLDRRRVKKAAAMPKATFIKRAVTCLLYTSLSLREKLNSMPNNLSGGQQQRVAIARALITKPAIVLADEPTGNLDSRTSADVLGLLKMTSEQFNQTVVMITHNNEIAQLSHRIVRIEDGRIVEKQQGVV